MHFVFCRRYKVQVTKPSTVLKLKRNFISLLTAEKETPQLNDIVVCVVRNSQIISIMVSPFAAKSIRFVSSVQLRRFYGYLREWARKNSSNDLT